MPFSDFAVTRLGVGLQIITLAERVTLIADYDSMEISLEDARRRSALLVTALIVCTIVIFEASRIWLASHWLASGKSDVMQRAAGMTPADGSAWDAVGRSRQWDFLKPDLPDAIADYQKALRDDPRSAYYWMDLASAYEAVGNDTGASDAFQNARAAYPESAEVAFYYGNFLIRQQRYAEAYPELRRAVRADPSLLPLVISRSWRATEDVSPLLDQILPQSVDAYLQALSFFSSIHRGDAALAVWQRLTSLKQKVALPATFSFFDELIREDSSDDARRAWREAVAAAGLPHEEPTNHSSIWNGNFAGEFANGGLGWRWEQLPGTSIDIDRNGGPNGSNAIRLDFNGGNNTDLESPLQYVPVEPGQSYHFHAELRTEEITTDSGIRFSISDAKHNIVNLTTENFTGSHAWAPIDADITTGPETHFLSVRLARFPSRAFDSRLSGTAWIADLSLIPTGTAERASP